LYHIAERCAKIVTKEVWEIMPIAEQYL